MVQNRLKEYFMTEKTLFYINKQNLIVYRGQIELPSFLSKCFDPCKELMVEMNTQI